MTNIQAPGATTNELLEGLHSIFMEKYPNAIKVERKTYIAYKDKTNIQSYSNNTYKNITNTERACAVRCKA